MFVPITAPKVAARFFPATIFSITTDAGILFNRLESPAVKNPKVSPSDFSPEIKSEESFSVAPLFASARTITNIESTKGTSSHGDFFIPLAARKSPSPRIMP